jgi:membrane-bound ClpP family serine protease
MQKFKALFLYASPAHMLLCALVFLPCTSWAHGDLNVRPWLDGVLHVITAPMCFALLLGLALVALGLDDQQHYSAAGFAAGAACLTLLLIVRAGLDVNGRWAQAFTAGAAAALGLLAIYGKPLARPWIFILAAMSGSAACLAAQLDRLHWQSLISMSASIGIITALFCTILRDLRRLPKISVHLPMASRIAGAWIACIGLLILALSLKMG